MKISNSRLDSIRSLVKQLSTNRSNPALGEAVLPRGLAGRRLRLDPELPDPIEDAIRKDRVIVMDQEADRDLIRERLPKLLDQPA